MVTVLRGGILDEGVGAVLIAGGGMGATALGLPIVISTLFRVPVVVIDGEGVRFPMMGVPLTWPEVAAVTVVARPGGRARPAILVIPVDSAAVVRQARPWLRRAARSDIARHGTPQVVRAASLNRPLDDIVAAVRQYR